MLRADLAPRPLDDREPAGARPPAAARCRCSASPKSASAPGRPQIQRYNQSRRIFVGADLAPGVVKGAGDGADPGAADHEEPAAGVSNAPVGDDKWQAEMINNFIIARGQRASCWSSRCWCCSTALRLAAGQHDLAAAGAARRAAGAVADRPADLDAGLYRPADAARHRRQELDPADRLRDRGDGTRACPRSRRSSMPGTSAPSRS